MMSLTFGLFTQVSGSGPLGPIVFITILANKQKVSHKYPLNAPFARLCSSFPVAKVVEIHGSVQIHRKYFLAFP